jgi:hypothetical protein
MKCRLCNRETKVIVNIDFKAVPVCDPCCLTITKQTVVYLTVSHWCDVDTGEKSTEIGRASQP